MTRIAKNVGVLAILVLLLIPILEAADKPKNSPSPPASMTLWQARRTVIAGSKFDAYLQGNPWGKAKPDPTSFHFTLDSFEFDALSSKTGTHHVQVDLKTLEGVSAKCDHWRCSLKAASGKPAPSPLDQLVLHENRRSRLYISANDEECLEDCVHVAQSFAAAINRLHAFAIDTESSLRNFTQRAAAWRALPTKPPIPEEIRAQRLLAENAVKEKRPEEALFQYETGLQLYPTWPQGYFNAALIAAELGYFADAVSHMQSYLELLPDAPDAQSARDQIVIWQYKAKGTK